MRVLIVAGAAAAIYGMTLLGVRVAGRRTVAQLSAFDAVITIALGSIVGATATRSSSLSEGGSAVGTLLLLQIAVGWARRRSPLLQRLLDFRPERIVQDGTTTLPDGIFSSQLTEAELCSRLRMSGYSDVPPGAVVLLEPTGAVSVVSVQGRAER